MQVSLLPFDEHDKKRCSAHESAGDEKDPVLQELPAEIHAEEPIESRSRPRTQWNRT